jgi:ferric-dicitrate binding protein FerR (iron transport regulator)
MNVTKEVITDLFPLYLANECSADSRALVEQYLRQNPNEEAQLRRIMGTSALSRAPQLAGSEELRALCQARSRLRRQSLVLGLAIFFSLLPFSFLATGERVYWLLRESPGTAVVYGAIGVACWGVYFVLRARSRILSKP